MNNKPFNIIIVGVGGQGVITLLQIIIEAAFIEGYDTRSSELHGLSQRGGSVETHIRFGKRVYSPLVPKGTADLIISLEMLEGLRALKHLGEKTKLLINKHYLQFDGSPKEEEIINNLKQSLLRQGSEGQGKNEVYIIPASSICQEKLQKEVVSGIYLLGYGVYKNLIPLKEESVLKAIENIVSEKYRELNIKAFKLTKDNL